MLFQSCITRKPAYLGEDWNRHTKTDHSGFDSEKLDVITDYIQNHLNTTGLVAVYKGEVIYEYGDIEQVSYIASCRKSVLSILYGKHIENGTIDLTQTIGELGIHEKDGLLPIEKEATVDHIITSRSGVFHVASNGGYDIGNFKTRGSVKPGEYFVYNNWDFNVGGHILEQATGKTVYEELEEQLAIPLGFQDWNIKNQRKSGKKKNSQYPAYHIYISTRDMAKIGQLMLNDGMWNGNQLISKEWIQTMTSTITPVDTVMARRGYVDPNIPTYSYGYMWWLIDNYKNNEIYEGAYTASGYGGQYITVIPKADLVIAHKTKLNLATLLGLKYKATRESEYFRIVDELIKAKLE